jgi:hypothetical protein
MSSHRARRCYDIAHGRGAVLAALAVTMFVAPFAATAQCTVTTLADTTAAGSLRACIAAANDNQTINFDPSLAGGSSTWAGLCLSPRA